MAETTVNYIEIDGEGKDIEDTAAREGVAQNATQINAIQEVIPSDTAANNKLVNKSFLTNLLSSYLKQRTDITDMDTRELFCGANSGANVANLPNTRDYFSFASFGTFQIAIPYNGYATPNIYVRENTNTFGLWYVITGQYLN